jgi:hypothetical protein
MAIRLETGNQVTDMRQMGSEFGAELRRRRIEAGLSLRDLAALVHYSRGHLSKIETMQAAASVELARLCDAALQAGGELVTLAVPRSRSAPVPGDYSGTVWTMSMCAGSQGWFAAAPAMRPDQVLAPISRLVLPAPSQLDHRDADSVVEAFRSWFGQLRALGQRVSPGVLLPMLIAQTHTIRALAGSARGADRLAMLGLGARYAEYAGWMAQEAGDDGAALWWTGQAVRLATAADDSAMGTYAVVRRSLVCFYRGDHQETVRLSQQVQADRRAPARVRGLAALREAQGHALAGARAECQRSLDRAAQCLATADQEIDPLALGTSTVADPVAMITGWCLHDIGSPEDAVKLLDREVGRIPEGASRCRARYATRRALAYAAAGQVEFACDLTRQLLPEVRDVGSATIRIDLARLARMLGRWPANHAVRQIQPDIVGVFAAS